MARSHPTVTFIEDEQKQFLLYNLKFTASEEAMME